MTLRPHPVPARNLPTALDDTFLPWRLHRANHARELRKQTPRSRDTGATWRKWLQQHCHVEPIYVRTG